MNMAPIRKPTLKDDEINSPSRSNASSLEKISTFTPLILWIAAIFFMSSDQGSMPATSRIIRPLLEFLFSASPEESLQFYHFLIRKSAHFTAYAILALLAIRAFRRSDKRIGGAILSLVLVLIVACLDEINQSFNSNRSGSIYDVLLDLVGGIFAISVVLILTRKKLSSSPAE